MSNILRILGATLLLILSLLFIAYYIWLLIDSVTNHRRNRIVYVSSPLKTLEPYLETIVKDYVPDPSKVRVVEAGAGHAYISRFLATHYPWKEVVAVDISATRLLLARLCNIRQRASLSYVQANVFKFPYKPGDLIYCYLSPEIMQGLFEQKKLAGCLVLSLSFAIPNVEATEELPLPNWQKRLFVYDFRGK